MRYRVSAVVTIGTWTYVEADSPEEAIDLAGEREMGSLVHGACSDDPDETWVVEDLDGEPDFDEARAEEAE